MSATNATLVIGRALGTVLVTVRGDLDRIAMARLEGVLADLIHGQGNLAVVADLTGAVAPSQALDSFVAALRERFCGSILTVQTPAPAARSWTTARQ